MAKVIDILKLIRQLRGCVKYIKHIKQGNKGAILQYCTGFGKTFVAVLLLKKILKKWTTCTTIIVVPTTQLKVQWEGIIKEEKLLAKVYVINTVVLGNKKFKCDFLILDECHLFPKGLKFSQVFNKISYNLLLGLTATLTDELRDKLKPYAEVVDIITQKEGKDNNWISDYIEYNLPVELTDSDKEDYTKLNKEFNKYFSYFGFDFNLAMKCRKNSEAKLYADTMKWDHKQVTFFANRWGHFMKERKEWLYNTKCKIDLTVEIIKRFDVKTIVFSESKVFANAVARQLGDKAVAYHSYLDTELRSNNKTIGYLIKEGKTTIIKDLNYQAISFSELEKKYSKITKVGSTKLLKESLLKFTDNRYKISAICTAKKLNQGTDIPDVKLGIIGARTSSTSDAVQESGRICRKHKLKDGTMKRGVIVNIYVPKTQDEKWLKKAQSNPDVIWINSIDEIKFE